MDGRALAFVAYGLPAPKGSKRAFAVRRRDGSTGINVAEQPQVKAWEAVVRSAAVLAAVEQDWPEPENGPLALVLQFAFQRPRSHYRTGRHAGELRETAPLYPAVRPDVDKLSRAVLDAMIGAVIADDARVVHLRATKVYGLPVGVSVLVERLP